MKILSVTGNYSILHKDEISEKILGNTPMIFQIECETQEEHQKVLNMIERLL